jgi:hypothetical protein
MPCNKGAEWTFYCTSTKQRPRHAAYVSVQRSAPGNAAAEYPDAVAAQDAGPALPLLAPPLLFFVPDAAEVRSASTVTVQLIKFLPGQAGPLPVDRRMLLAKHMHRRSGACMHGGCRAAPLPATASLAESSSDFNIVALPLWEVPSFTRVQDSVASLDAATAVTAPDCKVARTCLETMEYGKQLQSE